MDGFSARERQTLPAPLRRMRNNMLQRGGS